MKQEYQSAYRKLHADQAFRDRLIHTLEGHDEPRRVRPRWLVPAALAACLIVLFGLGVPTLQRVLQPIESTSGVPSSNAFATSGLMSKYLLYIFSHPPLEFLHIDIAVYSLLAFHRDGGRRHAHTGNFLDIKSAYAA